MTKISKFKFPTHAVRWYAPGEIVLIKNHYLCAFLYPNNITPLIIKLWWNGEYFELPHKPGRYPDRPHLVSEIIPVPQGSYGTKTF